MLSTIGTLVAGLYLGFAIGISALMFFAPKYIPKDTNHITVWLQVIAMCTIGALALALGRLA